MNITFHMRSVRDIFANNSPWHRCGGFWRRSYAGPAKRCQKGEEKKVCTLERSTFKLLMHAVKKLSLWWRTRSDKHTHKTDTEEIHIYFNVFFSPLLLLSRTDFFHENSFSFVHRSFHLHIINTVPQHRACLFIYFFFLLTVFFRMFYCRRFCSYMKKGILSCVSTRQAHMLFRFDIVWNFSVSTSLSGRNMNGAREWRWQQQQQWRWKWRWQEEEE